MSLTKVVYFFLSLVIGIGIILSLYPKSSAIAWKGIVLDIETGEPIVGAVVVRSWDRIHATVAGSISVTLLFKEMLSDKNGQFKIFGKIPSINIPLLSTVEENPAMVYKPGYKFFSLREKTRVVELTRIPTISALRKKELDKAKDYMDFDFKHQLNLSFQIINKESEFIEKSTYLIDAQSLIKDLKDTSLSEVVRQHAAKRLAETADMGATDALISVLGDKSVDKEAIEALGKRKDQRAVNPLLVPRPGANHIFRSGYVVKALVQIGTPAVEKLCAVLKKRPSTTAIWALGEIKAPIAIEPLLNALYDEQIFIRRAAAEALCKFNKKQMVTDLITIALRDKDEKVRLKASEALGKISSSGLDTLIAQSQNEVADINKPSALISGNESGLVKEREVKYEIKALKNENFTVTIPPEIKGIDPSLLYLYGISIPKVPQNKPTAIVHIAAERQKDGTASLTFGKAKDHRMIEREMLLLKNKHSSTRMGAVLRLTQIQDHNSLPCLIDALYDENKEVGFSAAFALGKIKHPLAVRYLAVALKDDDQKMREKAAHALADINNTIVLVPIVNTIEDLKTGMKVPVALVRFRDDWIENQLIKGIRNEYRIFKSGNIQTHTGNKLITIEPGKNDKKIKGRNILLDVLKKIKNQNAAERIIAEAKKNKEKRFLVSAFPALVQIGKPAIKPLIIVLKEEDSALRKLAAWALGEIGDSRAVEPLIFALQDENLNVRSNTARALGKIKDPGAVNPLFAVSIKDKESKVRKQALLALVEMGPVAVEKLLLGLNDTYAYSRWRAAWALGKIKADEAAIPLVNALRDEAPEVKWMASFALAEIKDTRAIESLDILKNEQDLGLKSCAQFSLRKILREK